MTTLLVAFVALWIVWKIVKGIIRIGLMLLVVGIVAYVLLNLLR